MGGVICPTWLHHQPYNTRSGSVSNGASADAIQNGHDRRILELRIEITSRSIRLERSIVFRKDCMSTYAEAETSFTFGKLNSRTATASFSNATVAA
jgi:hypothetical protein